MKNGALKRAETIRKVLGYLDFRRLFPHYATWWWWFGRRFLPLRGDTLFVGKRGAGKSVLAMRLAFEDRAGGVVTNVAIDEARFNELRVRRGLRPKRFARIQKPREFFDRHCWYRWLDEAQKYFPARKFKDADEVALAAVAEERKDDAWTAYTVQALRNLDVLVSGFCDSVALVKIHSFPLIGFVWPSCVRPRIVCRHQDCDPEEHTRRDGEGDTAAWWRRWLGYGTVISWTLVDPDVFNKGRTLDGSAQPEPMDDAKAAKRGVIRVRGGMCLFDRELADCFDSGQKIEVPSGTAEKSNLRKLPI